MKATGVSGGDQGRGKSRGIHMTEEEKGTPRRAAISTHPLWVSVQASTRLRRGGGASARGSTPFTVHRVLKPRNQPAVQHLRDSNSQGNSHPHTQFVCCLRAPPPGTHQYLITCHFSMFPTGLRLASGK